ncbi:MAG: glycosyltransferase [Flavisolibacter sp.]
MSPAITAVIINYNQGIYFEDCFASIKEQTFKDFELIVIDDRSTDDSVEQIKAVLSRYNFPHRLVVNEKNQGICANLNMALQMANGKYFTFIASDDWGEKSRFEKMHAALTAAGNENKVAYSDCKLVDPEKKLLHESYLKHFRPDLSSPPQGRVFGELVRGNFIPAMCTLISHEALLEIGGFDESLKFEDYDLWLRLARKYDFVFVPGAEGYYRILQNSLIRSLGARKFEDLIRVYMKHLDASGEELDLVKERVQATCGALYYTNSHRFYHFYTELKQMNLLTFKLRALKFLKGLGLKGSLFKKL